RGEGLGWVGVTGRPSGTPVGWAGLRPPSSHGLDRTAADTAELGYRLLPAAWRRGYATEAARALLGSAFSDLGLRQVVATTMTVNQASRRVLDKAGLSLVRTFYAAWPSYLEGAEHGDVEYAAVNATSQARATGHRLCQNDAPPRGSPFCAPAPLPPTQTSTARRSPGGRS